MHIEMSMRQVASTKIEMSELLQKLEEHKLWLENHEKGKQADFSNISLSGMDLSGLDFSYTIMNGIHMWEGNLEGANLSHASIRDADILFVNLSCVNIEETDFSGSHISECTFNGCHGNNANFFSVHMNCCHFENAVLNNTNYLMADVLDSCFDGSELTNAGFVDTDLDNTSFINTNLKDACFYGAKRTYWCDFKDSDMTGVSIYDVDFDEKNLEGVKGLYMPIFCPEEGSFIAWKKCREDKIVKLLIPEHAERKGNSRNTLRASEAVVLDIYDKNGDLVNEATSFSDKEFKYIKGETVMPKDPDKAHQGDWDGIYFVLSRGEAERLDYIIKEEDGGNEDE